MDGPGIAIGPQPLLITGTPGVGKSTICRAVAQSFSLAAHIEADVLHRFVVAGGRWPSAGTPDADIQLVLRTRNAVALAVNFRAAGALAVIDELVTTADQLTELDTALPDCRVVLLAAEPHVILDRDAHRDKHTAANYIGTAERIQALLDGRAVRIETDRLSIEETVRSVLGALS